MKTFGSQAVQMIARCEPHRYDRTKSNNPDAIGAGVDDRAELERRLDAGERLSTGEVAVLLETSRWTVDRILAAGTVIGGVRYEIQWTALGRNRELNPDDVRKILDARRKLRGASTDPTP